MSPGKLGRPGTEQSLIALSKAAARLTIAYSDLAIAAVQHQTLGGSKVFGFLITVIEFALEPDASEAAIGNLLEHIDRRRSRGRTYLLWYMTAQTGWILVNRVFDLISRFYKARAGL